MDDLIDRQAALNILYDFAGHIIDDTPDKRYQSAYREHRHKMETLPSAEPRWMPVTERLPEESGRYLVTRGLNACGSLWNRSYIANYSDLMGIKSEKIWWQGNVGKSDFERLDDVLAWMPLPQPWKGEKP